MAGTGAVRQGGAVRAALAALFAATLVAAVLPRGGVAPTVASASVDVASVDVAPEVTRAAAHGTVEAIVAVDPASFARAVAAIESTGGSVRHVLPLVSSVAAELTADSISALEATPGVRAIGQDAAVHLDHTAEAGQAYDDSTFVETIGADSLHASGITGAGVGIALVDTGVNAVADLAGRVTHQVDLSGEGDGVDRYGHGTFVAGVAAGDGAASSGEHAGVAPGASLISIKIAGASGATDVSQVLAAIQYAVSFKHVHDIEVLNLPIGTDSAQSWTTDILNFAVERAWHAGIVVVVSSGNAGPDPSTVMKPADDPWVITVGASDSTSTVDRSDDTVAAFSSRGPTRTDGLAKPDLVAPGSHLIGLRADGSTVDAAHPEARVGTAYFRGSGTSFAAAVTSGAVALLKQAHPDWTPNQVKGALLASVAGGPVGDPNVDGKGALDVAAAAALTSPPAANGGLGTSSGRASFGKSRGNVEVKVKKSDGTEDILDDTDSLTAQGRVFDVEQFLTGVWNGTSWQSGQWSGTSWQGTSWQGTSWQGTSWQGTSWQGTSWQ